jgi:hypothetical protein
MIPVGYMAKKSVSKPAGIELATITDVYSVGSCVNDDFADYIDYWKHNGFWFFDSPQIIQEVARENSLDLQGALLFYYEVHEMEFNEKQLSWSAFSPESAMRTDVVIPVEKRLEGFDLVTFYVHTSPECSPLSCCGLAREIRTNSHCLIETFEEARAALETGKCSGAEPGPYRIFAVYSVDWPDP